MGHHAQATGRTFENILGYQHNLYRAQMRADVWQNEIRAFAVTDSDTGEVKYIPRPQSRPDFEGILMGGQHVAFDAKHRTAYLYRHKLPQAHQLVMLHEAAHFGALAFLLVTVAYRWAFIIWPQPSWADGHMDALPLRTATIDQALKFSIDSPDSLCDWLSVVEKHDKTGL